MEQGNNCFVIVDLSFVDNRDNAGQITIKFVEEITKHIIAKKLVKKPTQIDYAFWPKETYDKVFDVDQVDQLEVLCAKISESETFKALLSDVDDKFNSIVVITKKLSGVGSVLKDLGDKGKKVIVVQKDTDLGLYSMYINQLWQLVETDGKLYLSNPVQEHKTSDAEMININNLPRSVNIEGVTVSVGDLANTKVLEFIKENPGKALQWCKHQTLCTSGKDCTFAHLKSQDVSLGHHAGTIRMPVFVLVKTSKTNDNEIEHLSTIRTSELVPTGAFERISIYPATPMKLCNFFEAGKSCTSSCKFLHRRAKQDGAESLDSNVGRSKKVNVGGVMIEWKYLEINAAYNYNVTNPNAVLRFCSHFPNCLKGTECQFIHTRMVYSNKHGMTLPVIAVVDNDGTSEIIRTDVLENNAGLKFLSTHPHDQMQLCASSKRETRCPNSSSCKFLHLAPPPSYRTVIAPSGKAQAAQSSKGLPKTVTLANGRVLELSNLVPTAAFERMRSTGNNEGLQLCRHNLKSSGCQLGSKCNFLHLKDE